VNRPAPAAARADRWISRLAGATVVGLAGIAGAISYSHTRQLAQAHGDAGWHAHAFPLSVDGIEIVASLVLLADRRAGRRSGWLPWAALAFGTAASIAANIATADTGAISRIIAGWPALALLIAIKLLSGILEHRPVVPVSGPTADADRDGPANRACPLPRQAVAVPPTPTGTPYASRRETRRPQARDSTLRRPALANTTGQHASSPDEAAAVAVARPGIRPGMVPGTAADITALLAAARAGRDELHRDGYPLTRDALATRLHQAGHPVRNARVTPVLQTLRSEPVSLSLNGR